jgi:dihydrofolate reductase
VSRRLRYHVAVSLDGFIARPNGDYDWIVADPAIDFNALYKEFDIAVMGRKTYAPVAAMEGHGAMPGIQAYVFSRTLAEATYPGVRIVNDDPRTVVAELKKGKGKDIWLFGGGELFRSLLDAGLVDTVEVAVMPVLLGSGIPLLPPGSDAKLVLTDLIRLPKSGTVALAYSVKGSNAAPVKIAYIRPGKPSSKKTAKAPAKKKAKAATKTARGKKSRKRTKPAR